ncbi:hypothetical protein NEISICOT_02825 [Neisseria sicca ATCC 29256]|uniref:Uncharacterized protein n=1 Tax=Neisseria sicca ATCC 29256 TaxID=547045 RepID=C6M8F6_NEISI|nr:hypothetical protein NEISICOT_02825 [Neisseria sicca ATCC 29256]
MNKTRSSESQFEVSDDLWHEAYRWIQQRANVDMAFPFCRLHPRSKYSDDPL